MDKQKTIGLLGGGQLGRMFLESANRLNQPVLILDAPGSSAKQISARDHLSSSPQHIDGSFQDPKAVEELASKCDVLTVEIEHVDTRTLEKVASKVDVQPSWETLRTIQDKFAQKEHLTQHSIPVAPYAEIKDATPAELEAIGRQFGYPYMLKAKTQAYDGRGNFKVRTSDDHDEALKFLHGRPLYAEKYAPFTKELAVMVVKTHDKILSYPTVETVHEDSICKLVYAPARGVPTSILQSAQKLARDAVAAFTGKGVFGVEMFLLPPSQNPEDPQILINEIAPRPHNSGHYTIEACPLSQYDCHLRSILDKPIPERESRLREPAIMLNILGGATGQAHLELARKAEEVGGSVHLYGKGEGRPGRKMGHITLTAPSMFECESRMAPLIELSKKIRAERSDLPASTKDDVTSAAPFSKPQVAIATGSKSDQPKLQAAYDLLSELGIPVWKRITSAHRTPDHMATFAKEAESMGVKVIIAAAGGAAHLPGMVAAYTTLPVIGVPIVLKGEGMDSVLSILNMPSGVPVATVAADKSANAALLAARVLALTDPAVDARLKAWVARARQSSLDTDEALREEVVP